MIQIEEMARDKRTDRLYKHLLAVEDVLDKPTTKLVSNNPIIEWRTAYQHIEQQCQALRARDTRR